MIFCVLPESWFETPMGVQLERLTARFFHKTKRVSAVMYVIEKHVAFEKGGPLGQLHIEHVCLSHPSPRFHIKFLPLSNKTWEASEGLRNVPTTRRSSEFFSWVDSIFLSNKTRDDAPQKTV
jgi:hypothetical protein